MYRPVYNHPYLEPIFRGLDKIMAHVPHTGSAFYTDAYGEALYGATKPIVAGPHGDRFTTIGGTPLGARIDALIEERKNPSLPR